MGKAVENQYQKYSSNFSSKHRPDCKLANAKTDYRERRFTGIRKNLQRILITCIGLFLMGIAAYPQNQAGMVRFRHLTINEGLSHTDATSVAQDDQGYIWIGTFDGLQRYDGYRLKTYFNNISAANRVYNNRINKIATYKNWVWLGTQGGLQCYDIKKEKFLKINVVNDTENILKANVAILNIDREGNLWVGNTNKLFYAVYDEKTEQLYANNIEAYIKDFPQRKMPPQFFNITNDQSENYWLSTNWGLIQFKKEEKNFRYLGLLQPRKREAMLDPVRWVSYKKGALWLIADDAIYGYYVGPGATVNNDNLIKRIPEVYQPKSVYGEEFSITPNALLIDNNNSLWGISNKGVWKIENPMQKNAEATLFQHAKSNPFSLSSDNTNSLFMDRTNGIWFGTWGGGINYLDLELKKFYQMYQNPEKPNYSLNDDFIRCMIKASDGKLLIGTRGGGINIYNPEDGHLEFIKSDKKNPILPNNQIRVLKQIDAQNILVGTATGVRLYNIKSKKVSQFPNETINNATLFAADVDHTGQIWAGSWGNGLYIVKKQENGTWSATNLNANSNDHLKITSNSINYVMADHAKREILVSTNKGLNRIKLNMQGEVINITHYISQPNYDNSIENNFIWPIAKENDSIYWIGSLGGGLIKFKFREGHFEDGTGKYHATIYSTEQGAPGNQVESIVIDNNNHIWIGGKGLSRFNPITEEFWNFDVNDGLQSNGFKIGSAYKDRAGFLYFGGIAGMNYFKPNEIQKNKIPPTVAISEVFIRNKELSLHSEKIEHKILSQSISYTKEINLKSYENDIIIRFSSLHYANPLRCKYRYKLDGFDDDWVYTNGVHPQASFSNLSYGSYRFIIEASNNDGLWGTENAELAINIAAPWYFSTLAYIIYLVVFMLLITLGIVYFSNWITMKHKLQLKVVEEKRMKEIHSMKLQFFTNISHEFKNPLSLILTPVEEMLEKDLPAGKRIEYLQIIQKNARRMLKLINELMDFRKAEMNKTNLQAELAPINEFVEEIYNQFTNYAKTKGINIDYKGSTTELWFDKEIVSKIVTNLLSNSLKFTNENGNIKIRIFECKGKESKTRFEHFFSVGGSYDAEKYCCVQILDDGVGISETSLPHIFDRFFHIESKTSNHLGSGIGLALVKTLVLAHKGTITVSSEREKGTEFIVKFPMGESHLTAEEKVGNSDFILESEIFDPEVEEETISAIEESDEENENEESKQTILVVEDNHDLRKMVINHFSSKFHVIDADNGTQGLELAQENLPDLIISDIMMPGIDGLELCKNIKQDINTSHIPVVLLTAKTSLEDQIVGAESGADMYVSKPFSMKLLDLKVNQLIETRNYLRDRFVKDFYGETREIAQNTKDKEFLDKLINIIEENIENSEFSVQILCREVGMCRTNLYKKVRSLTNQSLGDFIRMLRLKNAAKILMEEDVTISEAALRVGINSTSYFTKAFKAQYSMTPTQFLQKYRDNID